MYLSKYGIARRPSSGNNSRRGEKLGGREQADLLDGIAKSRVGPTTSRIDQGDLLKRRKNLL